MTGTGSFTRGVDRGPARHGIGLGFADRTRLLDNIRNSNISHETLYRFGITNELTPIDRMGIGDISRTVTGRRLDLLWRTEGINLSPEDNPVLPRFNLSGIASALSPLKFMGFADRTILFENIMNQKELEPGLFSGSLASAGIVSKDAAASGLTIGDISLFTRPSRLEELKASLKIELDPADNPVTRQYTALKALSYTTAKASGFWNHEFFGVSWLSPKTVTKTSFKFGLSMTLGTAGVLAVTNTLLNFDLFTSAVAAFGGLSLVSARFADRLPEGSAKRFASYLSTYGRPLAVLAGSVVFGNTLMSHGFDIQNGFQDISPFSTFGLMGGLYAYYRHLKNDKLNELDRSYGGQTNPGERWLMRKMTGSAVRAVFTESTYLAARATLFGGSSWLLFENAMSGTSALSWLTPLSIALPVIALGATVGLRNMPSSWLPGWKWSEKEQSSKWFKMTSRDAFMTRLPYLGFAGGAGLSLLAGAAEGSLMPAFLYGTFWSSFLTLFASELHGSFHSMNTSLGHLASLRAPSRDIIGRQETKRYSDDKKVLLINPDTGNVEHTKGALFTALLMGKPNVSFVNMLDKIPQADLGNVKIEKMFLRWISDIQRALTNKLEIQGLANMSVSEKFEALAANLESLASYMGGELKAFLQEDIHGKFKGKPELKLFSKETVLANAPELNKPEKLAIFFDVVSGKLRPKSKINVEELAKKEISDVRQREYVQMLFAVMYEEYTEEAFNAAFEQLDARVSEYRSLARSLRDKARSSFAVSGSYTAQAEADFYRDYENLMKRFDPDFVTYPFIARKEMNHDDWKVRKVENVATIGLFRGLTVYKLWKVENKNYPTVDWVTGTWTRVQNPEFRYGAKPGTMEASKYIWIKAERVLQDLQKENEAYLSTSDYVARTDNDPSKTTGFEKGSTGIKRIVINGRETKIAAGDYFWVSDKDQLKQPEIAGFYTRGKVDRSMFGENADKVWNALVSNGWITKDGLVESKFYTKKDAFRLGAEISKDEAEQRRIESEVNGILEKATKEKAHATKDEIGRRFAFAGSETSDKALMEHIDITSPLAICFPDFYSAVMMDKNDIQVFTYSKQQALLERERENKALLLVYRFPVGKRYTFNNPYPEKAISSVDVLNGNIELAYSPEGGAQRMIPYEVDRSAIVTQRNGLVDWARLRDVDVITETDKQTGEVRRRLILNYSELSETQFISGKGLGNDSGSVVNPLINTFGIPEYGKIREKIVYFFNLSDKEVELEVKWNEGKTVMTVSDGSRSVEIAVPEAEKDSPLWKNLYATTKMKFYLKGDLVLKLVGNYQMEVPESAFPRYLETLGLPREDGKVTLQANAFKQNPDREGDISWYRIRYEDGTLGFVRCEDRDRPMLFNKTGRSKEVLNDNNERSHVEVGGGYYNIETRNEGKEIVINGVCLPRGVSIPIPAAWFEGIKEGDRITEVDNSGKAFIDGGIFYPVRPEKSTEAKEVRKGSALGLVTVFGEDGSSTAGPVIDLGNYFRQAPGKGITGTLLSPVVTLDASKHVSATLEMRRGSAPDRLLVIERRLEQNGLEHDRSAYVYNISNEAEAKIIESIPDLGWIRSVRVNPDKSVTIRFAPEGVPDGQEAKLELGQGLFTDNFGRSLLDNKDMGVKGLSDIYQSDPSIRDDATDTYNPVIDTYHNGRLCLVVHKVNTYEIKLPQGTELPEGKIKVSPQLFTSAVKIGNKWVPVSKSLPNKEALDLGADNIDLSRIDQTTRDLVEKNLSEITNDHWELDKARVVSVASLETWIKEWNKKEENRNSRIELTPERLREIYKELNEKKINKEVLLSSHPNVWEMLESNGLVKNLGETQRIKWVNVVQLKQIIETWNKDNPNNRMDLTEEEIGDLFAILKENKGGFSQAIEGIIKSVIGPQTRFGNVGEISGEYARDPYFYGLQVNAMYSTIKAFGEHFGLNRAKSIRAFRGIQSGRTHMMSAEFLFNPLFADIMETNSDNFKKMSNYGGQFWGVGVSEDTQMEMVAWMLGVKMHVIKEMVAIMAAEKTFDKYKVQNAVRYIFSETLFVQPFKLIAKDLVKGLNPKASFDPFYFASLEAMWEITAGRTWYKWAWAKMIELGSLPVYNGSMGNILSFPVDIPLFIPTWAAKTASATMNYKLQLNSLGFGVLGTGLWDNPAKEIGFLAGYFKSANWQYVEQNQMGTFMLTSAGASSLVPREYKQWVNKLLGFTLATSGVSMASLLLGGFDQLGTLAGLGMGINLLFSGYQSAVLMKTKALQKREGLPVAKQRSSTKLGTIENRFIEELPSVRKLTEDKSVRNRSVESSAAQDPSKAPSKALKDGISSVVEGITSSLETLRLISPLDEKKTAFTVTQEFKNMVSNHEYNIRETLLNGAWLSPSSIPEKFVLPKELAAHTREVYELLLGLMRDEQLTADFENYASVKEELAAGRDTLGYDRLYQMRDSLKATLYKLGAINSKGATSISLQNAWRDEANLLVELYTQIEMTIAIRSIETLKASPNDANARMAIKKLMQETQEHIVIETASNLMKTLNIKVE